MIRYYSCKLEFCVCFVIICGSVNYAYIDCLHNSIPYRGKVLWGERLVNRVVLSIWQKKVWRINRSANRLLIISTNLDGFSLANHGRFAKFANISHRQSFPPYSI